MSSRKSARNLTHWLRDEIADMIVAEALQPGEKLPTEAEFTRRFSVSRPALREALKLLEQDNIIYVRHGLGRFVSALAGIKVDRPITAFESVTRMTARFGYRPIGRLLSIGDEVPPDEVAETLRLEKNERVIRLERLRMNGDNVIMYCVDFVPRRLVPDRPYDIDWTGSLFVVLETYGIVAAMSSAKASAVMLPDDVADRNDLHDFGPAFLIEETVYTTDGKPVVFARDYHRGDAFNFSFMRT